MNYLNITFKLAKFHEKSKKKYEKILKNSKNAFPSFLSTKHYYKRRKAIFFNDKNRNNLKKINILSERKKETNLIQSSLVSKRNADKSNKSNKSKSKMNDSPLSTNLFLKSDNNIKNENKIKKSRISFYKNNLSAENNKNAKFKKVLTSEYKLKLKSILQNFQNNKLTTNNLCKQEKKQPLNSLTENNFLFLFGNSKNKYSHKKRMKQLIYNKTVIDSMPKSALISMKMMKKFNEKTNKIYEEEKLEGIKFSKNINEFRRQIINSYKDSFRKDDLTHEKMNYNNAINFLSVNQDKKIKKAYELEKEFYKNKYHELDLNYSEKDYMDGYFGRKINKRKSTKKLEFNSISSKNNSNILSFIKESYFNNKEEKKILDYTHRNIGENYSYSHQNKYNSFSPNRKNNTQESSFNTSNTVNKTDKKYIPNNLYLNYMKNIRKRKSNAIFPNNSVKVEYDNYVKKCIKERSKQLADSLASINFYFEYQPLKEINSDIPQLNINQINLKRVVKVNEIRKNLNSFDDDDLLIHNINKLKEEIRDAELKYYSIEKHNNNYHLSFVKNNVRRSTLEKANAIKNPRFGVPC